MMDKEKLISLVNNMSIDSAHLSIRKGTHEDKHVMMKHEQNPKIMQFILDIQSEQAIMQKVEQMLALWQGEEMHWVCFVITAKQGDDQMASEAIGYLFLRVESFHASVVEIGYRLDPACHGKGVGSEAVLAFVQWIEKQVKPQKIMATCVADNIASWKIMQKVGMQQEGCLRSHTRLNKRWHDELIFAKIIKKNRAN